MTATFEPKVKPQFSLEIRWEPLPEDFYLEDEPVDNMGQPLLAGALQESLELSGYLKPTILVASNFALCATLNGQFVAKAPDWLYVASVEPLAEVTDRKSYTPNLQGDAPAIVMEFLSDTEGGEYSVKRTYPPGKWFFYEQILQVPVYVIFEPATGLLEFYHLQAGRYELQQPDFNGRHWIESINLFLGTWQGTKETRTGYWLRWWNPDGELLPWAVERVEAVEAIAAQERQRAEQERQRAEQERQRADRLATYFRAQGLDPDNLP